MKYPKFKVAVRCFTFNQSRYIEETMNGFTMQQTNFPYVCCIVDDASTDGEQQVIIEYIKEYFDITDTAVAYQKETDYAHVVYAQHKINKNCFFAALFLKENHYSQRKSKMAYLKEWNDGVPYEALCEGDDYWIATDKLQMQADFLDENPEYGLTYSQAFMCNQNGEIYKSIILGSSGCHSFSEMIEQNPVPTLSTMFRRALYEKYRICIKPNPLWKMGDYPIWLFFSLNSKVHFFEKPLAVYRVLSESASHSRNTKKKLQFLKGQYLLRKEFVRYANRMDLLNKCRRKYLYDIAVAYLYQIAVALKIK